MNDVNYDYDMMGFVKYTYYWDEMVPRSAARWQKYEAQLTYMYDLTVREVHLQSYAGSDRR